MTIIRGEAISETVYEYYPRYLTIGNGVLQLLCGLVLGALSFSSQMRRQTCGEPFNEDVDMGLTASIWAIVAGSLAIAAGCSRTSCKIAANIVLSIIACMCSSIAVTELMSQLHKSPSSPLEDKLEPAFECFTGIRRGTSTTVILIIAASVEAIVALVSSIVSCQFVCLCCRNCCCHFNVTKTQELLLADNVNELAQVISHPTTANTGGTVASSAAKQHCGNAPPEYTQPYDIRTYHK